MEQWADDGRSVQNRSRNTVCRSASVTAGQTTRSSELPFHATASHCKYVTMPATTCLWSNVVFRCPSLVSTASEHEYIYKHGMILLLPSAASKACVQAKPERVSFVCRTTAMTSTYARQMATLESALDPRTVAAASRADKAKKTVPVDEYERGLAAVRDMVRCPALLIDPYKKKIKTLTLDIEVSIAFASSVQCYYFGAQPECVRSVQSSAHQCCCMPCLCTKHKARCLVAVTGSARLRLLPEGAQCREASRSGPHPNRPAELCRGASARSLVLFRAVVSAG